MMDSSKVLKMYWLMSAYRNLLRVKQVLNNLRVLEGYQFGFKAAAVTFQTNKAMAGLRQMQKCLHVQKTHTQQPW